MKIAIVTSGGLPVPNVKGGGAQTLITAILDQNEIKGENEFVVFSLVMTIKQKSSQKNIRSQDFIFCHKKKELLKIKSRVR
ncbi:MAG: hypothetical protein ACLRR3_09160 [Eubacterium sp.]